MQIMERNPTPVRFYRSDIPAALDAAVARCLTRDPNGRFQTVQELASVLRMFASDGMRAILAARTSSPGIAVATAPAETMPMQPIASTAPPWSHTEGAASVPVIPGTNRSKIVAIVGVGVLAAIVAVVGAVAALKAMAPTSDVPVAAASSPAVNAPSASPSSPPSVAATPPAPPAMDVPPLAREPAAAIHEPSVPPARSSLPAVSPVQSPPATPSPGVAVPVTPPPAAPQAPSQPQPASNAARNCNPNYYFDKDGAKHFKVECF
jgi:hypothetical protein